VVDPLDPEEVLVVLPQINQLFEEWYWDEFHGSHFRPDDSVRETIESSPTYSIIRRAFFAGYEKAQHQTSKDVKNGK